MSDVELQEETFRRRTISATGSAGMASRLVALGYARDAAQANRYLLSAVVILVLATGVVWSLATPEVRETPEGKELIERMPKSGQ
ncbi:MAG TPA: hypothetical protein VF696_02380 [Candidatus Paceibacterota bacterium]|jgi:hypothetical protein